MGEPLNVLDAAQARREALKAEIIRLIQTSTPMDCPLARTGQCPAQEKQVKCG